MEYLNNLLDLFIDMSFYIVIGLIFTGLLHSFVNKNIILKHIGKKSTSSVVKASVFGVPLPLCSCGVVPTALYLGKSGASKGAVVSFLTSTPQTGVDSLIATYGLMGPLFAIYRAIAAFISGIISGIATNLFSKKDSINYSQPKSSCCSKPAQLDNTGCCSQAIQTNQTGCCSSDSFATEKHSHVKKASFFSKLKGAMSYAFGDFLDEISVHFIVGLLVAALISTAIPEQWLSSFTNPLLSMLIMLVIGIPMYICSTASIPIALSLIVKGISPGAAFVFLFAGPVTNIASLTILGKSLGKKVLAIYLGSAIVCAIAFGFILDYIIGLFNYSGISNIVANTGEHDTPVYMSVVAVIFGILIIISIFKKLIHKFHGKVCAHKKHTKLSSHSH